MTSINIINFYMFLICCMNSSKLRRCTEEEQICTSSNSSEILYQQINNNETEEFCNEPLDLTVKSKIKIIYPIKSKKRKTCIISTKLATPECISNVPFFDQHGHMYNAKNNITPACQNKCTDKLHTPSVASCVFSDSATEPLPKINVAEPSQHDKPYAQRCELHNTNAKHKNTQFKTNGKNNICAHSPVQYADDKHLTTTTPNIFNNSIFNSNSNTTSTKNYQNQFALETQKSNTNDMFFGATLTLLKHILYYRYNISKFFIAFDKNINNEDRQNVNKSKNIMKFIYLSIEYANTSNKCITLSEYIVHKDHINEIKAYEAWLINELKVQKDDSQVSNSQAYEEIKKFNTSYCRGLNATIRKTGFKNIYNFLFDIFPFKTPLTKYYPMLSSLLISIYDFSTIIEKKIDFILQQYLVECNVFEVELCCCSSKIKQYFIYHWAYCWTLYFSNNYLLPTYSNNKDDIFVVINSYPKEFFIQFILLVHIFINLENRKIDLEDIEKNYVVNLKNIIYKLLFVNVDSNMKTIYQTTLQTLFDSMFDIFNYKVYYRNNVQKTRVIQTLQENIDLSNTLIPILKYVIETIKNVIEEAYRQAQIKISH